MNNVIETFTKTKMTEIVQNEWQNKEWECFNDIGNCKLILFANKTVIHCNYLKIFKVLDMWYSLNFLYVTFFSKAALDIAVHYV